MFDILTRDYDVTIKIKFSDYSSTTGPINSTVNDTTPTSPSNIFVTNSPSNNTVAKTTTANLFGYLVGFTVGSSPQPSEDFTGDLFIISSKRLKPCTTYNVIVTATVNRSSICKLRGLTGATFKTRGMSKLTLL